MKKLLLTIVAAVVCGVAAYAQSQVVFWTNQNFHGYISVYLNGNYVGRITKYYSSAPGCGAAGCVTVTVRGSGNTWYGIAQDGTRWTSNSATLRSGCNSIRLYSSGARVPSRSSAPTSSSSTGGGSYTSSGGGSSSGKYLSETLSNTTETIMGGLQETAGRMVNVEAKHFPYLAVGAGVSRFSGQYVRVNTSLGGMAGAKIFGGLGTEFIFNRKNDTRLLWHVGFGFYIGGAERGGEFAMSAVIGETPECMNMGLMVDTTYTYFFGSSRRLGVYGTLGIGLGDFDAKDPEFLWDAGVGVTYKVWAKKPRYYYR